MEQASWTPTCDLALWKKRQDLIHKIRSFFHDRNVLEVEVPHLSRAMGTDPHLDYYETRYSIGNRDISLPSHDRRYLTTSPEFHLKRLLSAGFPDLYFLGKAFRNGESGARHNGEFTILEWYRKDLNWFGLMEEVACLCAQLAQHLTTPGAMLAMQSAAKITWREAYQKHCGFDPLHVDLETMESCAKSRDIPLLDGATHEEWLDYLMVLAIEPKLGKSGPEFLIAYPEAQAALAQVEVDSEGNSWARRFELYLDGIELCNGYQELADAFEQESRFKRDLAMRRQLGKPEPPMDQNFLDALRHGMPACSGVALGVDRLVMLLLGKRHLSEVLLFPDDRS